MRLSVHWQGMGVVAVWMLICPGMISAAEESDSKHGMGRLFTTMEIRERLNKLRLGHSFPLTEMGEILSNVEPQQQQQQEVRIPPGPRYLTMGGVVLHKDGSSTVWLNGHSIATMEGFVGENYRMESTLDPSHGIKIVLMDHGEPFLLHPGETLDAEEKKIRPSYEIPQVERLTARRGGEPDPNPKEKPVAAERARPVEPKAAAAAVPVAPADESAQKNLKKSEVVKPGGLEGLLHQAQEVVNALH